MLTKISDTDNTGGNSVENYSSYLYSGLRNSDKIDSAEYLIRFMGGIPDSCEFAQKNRKIMSWAKTKFIPEYVKKLMIYSGFWVLSYKGYDALMLKSDDNNEIIGHNAFQTHKDNTLHVFSVGVLEGYNHKGLAIKMQEDTIKIARARGIKSIRIGAGGSEEVKGLCQKLSSRSQELRITPRPEYWFDILK